MSKKPFWEKSYLNSNKPDTFSHGEPSREVRDVIKELNPDAKILDLGCGDGRNTLFIGSKGFYVKAVDFSKPGIDKLQKTALAKNISIDTDIQDMRDFFFKEKYDTVLAQYCFYLIEKEYWERLISDMKKNTREGGYNIISVFTDKLPTPDDLKEFALGVFNEGELFSFYTDWEIVLKKSFIEEDEHEGGIKHKHAINKIVARKPF